MRMHPRWLSIPALMFLLAATPASAGVIYDNGPVSGAFSAWTINEGFAVTDSFNLSGDATVTDVNFDVWAFPGDTPLSVDWAITTGPFGREILSTPEPPI